MDKKTSTHHDSLTGSEIHFIESSGGAIHSFNFEETNRFSDIINNTFQNDPELKDLLPLKPNSQDLFSVVENGILMCKLVNSAVPGTIDETKINKRSNMNIFQKQENINMAITGAKKIGCILVNMTPQLIFEKREHIILGFVWQLMRIKYVSKINLKQVPNLLSLKDTGEKDTDFLKVSPEQMLMRWFNHHLVNANCPNKITNFGNDLKDGLAYTYLLNQLNPDLCDKSGIILDNETRAEKVVFNSGKMGVEIPIGAMDIIAGNSKLNLLFCAQIFNVCPGLKPPPEPLKAKLEESIEPLKSEVSAEQIPLDQVIIPPVESGPSKNEENKESNEIFETVQNEKVHNEKVKKTGKKNQENEEIKENDESFEKIKKIEVKEIEIKKSPAIESEIKENIIVGSEIQVSELKESEVKESEVIEKEVKESEVKEIEVKESEMKESELKESEVKVFFKETSTLILEESVIDSEKMKNEKKINDLLEIQSENQSSKSKEKKNVFPEKKKGETMENLEEKVKQIEKEMRKVKGFCWWCILLKIIFSLVFFLNGYNHLAYSKEYEKVMTKRFADFELLLGLPAIISTPNFSNVINNFFPVESFLALAVVLYASYFISHVLQVHLLTILIIYGGCVPNIIASGTVQLNIEMKELLLNVVVFGLGLWFWEQKICWICHRKPNNK